MAGLDAALRVGADVLVNTDADNQYSGRRHPAAGSRRSLAGKAGYVHRAIEASGTLAHFYGPSSGCRR